MKQVTIKQITMEGFGSYVEPFTFNLNRKGINILRATNGRGKSTIFNAMVWSLYGISIKDVNKDKIVTYKHKRPKNFKGTQVTIDLSVDGVDYQIARHIKYKGQANGITGGDTLMIFQDGDLISAGKSLDDVQEQVNEIIGLDGRLFVNSVMFAQRAKKFINTSNTEKREVLEQVFDLEWISSASDFAKKEVDRIGKEISALEESNLSIQIPYNSRLAAYTANSSHLTANQERVALSLQTNESNRKLWMEQVTAKKELLAFNNSADIEKQISDLDTEISVLTTNLGVKESQLAELNAEETRLKSRLLVIDYRLPGTYASHASNVTSIAHKQEELFRLQEGKQEEINSVKARIDEIKTDVEVLTTSVEQLKATLVECPYPEQEVLAKMDAINKEILFISHDTNFFRNIIEGLEHDLLHLTDPCSKCNHTPTQDEIEPKRVSIEKTLEEHKEKAANVSLKDKALRDELGTWAIHANTHKANAEVRLQIQAKESEISASNALKYQAEAALSSLTSGAKEVQLQTEIASLEQQNVLLSESMEADNKELASIKALSKASDILVLEGEVKVAKEGIQAKNADLSALKQTQLSLASALSEVAMLDAAIKGAETEWANLKAEEAKHNDTAKALVLEYDDLMVMFGQMSRFRQQIQAKVEERDRYKWWQSTGFGTSGIKSLVFSVMLSKLNEAMQIYSQQLGVSARFVVDLEKARRDIDVEVLQDGHVVGYGGLSGGEQQRVDIVSMFGMHDLVSSSDVSVNVLCLDEVTENLDVQGVEEVFNLIKFKQQTTPAVWVITHNPELSITNANIVELDYEIQNA